MRALASIRRKPRGYALIMAMVFLLLLSGIAVAMLRKAGVHARIAGNVLDKTRAQQLADASLLFAERLLMADGSATAGPCNGVEQAEALARTPVCETVLANPTTLPWPARVEYRPSGLVLQADKPVPGATPSDIRYPLRPGFHIAWLGYSRNSDRLFAVTAYGYGGNESSVSVVRSVFVLSSDTRCGDCP